MAIGRTFQESFQKALRGLEVGVDGLNQKTTDREKIQVELGEPGPERIWYVGDAFAQGFSLEEVHQLTKIDPWFLSQIKEIVDIELALEQRTLADLDASTVLQLKRRGFSDRRLAFLLDTVEAEVRKLRHQFNVRPVYKRVDTCAAEFATNTAYLYSTYEQECESSRLIVKRSSCSVAALTVLVRVLNLIIAACMQRLHCARMVMRPS